MTEPYIRVVLLVHPASRRLAYCAGMTEPYILVVLLIHPASRRLLAYYAGMTEPYIRVISEHWPKLSKSAMNS